MLDRNTLVPADLTAFQLRALLLSRGHVHLVDVRTGPEIDSGMIPGACHLEWPGPFQDKITKLSKEEIIVLYCRTGNRAGQARDFMLGLGYQEERVINFGGFSKWTDASGPSVTQPTGECECVGIERGPVSWDGKDGIRIFPNPFNPVVTIMVRRYAYSVRRVSLKIYDISGKLVKDFTPYASRITPYTFTWNASQYHSGTYILKALIGNKIYSRKLILQK
jgi:rhodanese-related sulfurtransferase